MEQMKVHFRQYDLPPMLAVVISDGEVTDDDALGSPLLALPLPEIDENWAEERRLEKKLLKAEEVVQAVVVVMVVPVDCFLDPASAAIEWLAGLNAGLLAVMLTGTGRMNATLFELVHTAVEAVTTRLLALGNDTAPWLTLATVALTESTFWGNEVDEAELTQLEELPESKFWATAVEAVTVGLLALGNDTAPQLTLATVELPESTFWANEVDEAELTELEELPESKFWGNEVEETELRELEELDALTVDEYNDFNFALHWFTFHADGGGCFTSGCTSTMHSRHLKIHYTQTIQICIVFVSIVINVAWGGGGSDLILRFVQIHWEVWTHSGVRGGSTSMVKTESHLCNYFLKIQFQTWWHKSNTGGNMHSRAWF